MPGNTLRCRVHPIKRIYFVQTRVVQSGNDRVQRRLHRVKIAQQPLAIQLRPANRHRHAKIVPVNRLPNATQHNRVSRTELGFNR